MNCLMPRPATWAKTGCAARGIWLTVPVMLAYDVAGSGPLLVMLHSTVCDRRMWDPQWPVFADAGYRVVRCDFRGFGATPVPHGPHDDADDILEVADKLDAGTVALVGASYGGKVALEIAARWPRRVAALALVCAGMPGHEPTDALRGFWQREEELIEAGDIAGAVELNVATWLGPDASEATRERVRLMQRHAFEVQLAAPAEYEPVKVAVDLHAITAASLVISGAKDLPDFRLIAARLAALLPGARPVELPWAGHLPTLERPQELSEMLVVFLRDTVPAG
jgi:3-oxoadipate enol-lactonase